MGTEIPGDDGRGRLLYLTIHCHHQNDSCIKVGSTESHFNVSLIVRDKATRQVSTTTVFEERGEPKWNRTAVLLTARPNRLTGKVGWGVFKLFRLTLIIRIVD